MIQGNAKEAESTVLIGISVADKACADGLVAALRTDERRVNVEGEFRIVDIQEPKPAFGALGSGLLLAVVLAVPVPIAINIVSTWLMKKVERIKEVSIEIGGFTVRIAGKTEMEIEQIERFLRAAINAEGRSSESTPRRKKGSRKS